MNQIPQQSNNDNGSKNNDHDNNSNPSDSDNENSSNETSNNNSKVYDMSNSSVVILYSIRLTKNQKRKLKHKRRQKDLKAKGIQVYAPH